jgi:hypothetical protein
MQKKYIFLNTNSVEKFNEIRPHFLKYNIECSMKILNHNPFAILKEHSEIKINDDNTAVVTSYLIVEQINNSSKIYETQKVYTSKVKGYYTNTFKHDGKNIPWGYDAQFIPNGIMTSYYNLKKKGLKISPRDMNIGYFLQDFVHYNPNIWAFKNEVLKISRPVDLEANYKDILYNFFDFGSQINYEGYNFWKKIIDSAIVNGVFLKAANTRKMNNYWWPVGNAGLPVTCKPKDPMHEKTYMMHDIFHFLVPDLLYTGNHKNNPDYEWLYVLHRVMTECFTLVLGDMFYVHYMTINGVVYETVEKRRIYPIFQSIYGSRKDVFTKEIIEEVVRASCDYGINSSERGFIALFVKYNGSAKLDEFKQLLKNFREKYDYYIIQDLKWTINNASYMKEHKEKYLYLGQMPKIIKQLNIVTIDSIKLSPKPDIQYLIEIGMKQLWNSIHEPNELDELNTIKNKFLRWAIGQICFFEHYEEIPVISGYRTKFIKLIYNVADENEINAIKDIIKNFRYQWEYLLDHCSELCVITNEEKTQYKEVYPVFDPNYISSYEDKIDDHTEIMNNFMNNFKI